MAEVTSLPNPFTPLAFFPPDAAWQTSVFYYTSAGSVAVFVWDMLNNLLNDYKLVTRYRVGLPTAVYFLSSTICILLYLISTNIFLLAAPIGDCRSHGIRTAWLYPVAMGATAFLFFIRVRAIYHRSKFVTSYFFVLWLLLLLGTATIPSTVRADNIGPTKYCFTGSNISPLLNASGGVTLLFDTSVYLAITWRLTRDFYISTHRSDGGMRAMFTGENLPMFSRGLLQDGQVYYLSTAIFHLMGVILFNIYSLPLAYRFISGLPTEVVMNIMACRVYRSTKFGFFTEVSVVSTSYRASTTRGENAAVTIEFTKTDRSADVELGMKTSSANPDAL
ncbi:hypothetical protein GALMADRAFT_75822 [Galerina marginata CBS 339.88]|uniref:Glucose receptor Git3 N-terminal domain-containing protein n=1 Tax=Galerina marginata (strain CBS 339.88) TaxID=685588 RepID=A0A067SVC5_GALM3|nr:hypothetical protein GALMADRAFT_75822 [Galerina marginata CBS 339.88]